jgi:ABC-type amino acid transport substrate-binding protein
MMLRLVTTFFAAALGLALAGQASARTLHSIKERGRIVLCAHPNALPFAAKSGDRQGIQIELAKALADGLGVGLEVGWVVFPNQIPRVDCDIVLDSIVDEEVRAARRVRLSVPYQQGGVVLAFRPGIEPVADYTALKPGQRVGAIVTSLTQAFLGQHGVPTIPYTFEDDMMEALATGEIDVAAVSPTSAGFFNLTHPDAQVATSRAFASVPDLNWAVAVGMRKADDALVSSVNEALSKLLDDGTVHRIYASYGVEQSPPAR